MKADSKFKLQSKTLLQQIFQLQLCCENKKSHPSFNLLSQFGIKGMWQPARNKEEMEKKSFDGERKKKKKSSEKSFTTFQSRKSETAKWVNIEQELME